MTRSLRRPLRAVALLGIAAITAGSLGVVATPAFAAPGEGGKGSVTVHKYEQSGSELGPNDGTELDLSGVTVNGLVSGFTTCTIEGIDLAKASDWSRVSKLVTTASLTPGAPPAVTENGTPLILNCGLQQTTVAGTGITKFANLNADRAYVVYESDAPKDAIQAAAPTIITVPYPGTKGGEWNYNPHIYPKNTIVGSGSTKTGRIIQSLAGFTITVPVKPLAAGESYWEMKLEDQLSEYLTYSQAPTVKLTNAANTNMNLVAGTDYTVTPATNTAKSKVEFALTASGLAKFNNSVGGKLVMSLSAGFKSIGSTANLVLVTLNGVSSLGKGQRSGPTQNYMGGPIQVIDPETAYDGQHYQVNDAKTKIGIAGAGIQTYWHPAQEDAVGCPLDREELFEHPDWWEYAMTGPAPEDVMTNASGYTLFNNDNGGTVGNGVYCAYLDIVPAGYKDPGPLLFNIWGPDNKIEMLLERSDIMVGDLPALPITGATGNLVLIGSGAALLMAAGALALARRRGVEFSSPLGSQR